MAKQQRCVLFQLISVKKINTFILNISQARLCTSIKDLLVKVLAMTMNNIQQMTKLTEYQVLRNGHADDNVSYLFEQIFTHFYFVHDLPQF